MTPVGIFLLLMRVNFEPDAFPYGMSQAEGLANQLTATKEACDERDGELDDLRGELAAAQDHITDLSAEVDGHEADAAEQVLILPNAVYESDTGKGWSGRTDIQRRTALRLLLRLRSSQGAAYGCSFFFLLVLTSSTRNMQLHSEVSFTQVFLIIMQHWYSRQWHVHDAQETSVAMLREELDAAWAIVDELKVRCDSGSQSGFDSGSKGRFKVFVLGQRALRDERSES
jgi:hypothetical protein